MSTFVRIRKTLWRTLLQAVPTVLGIVILVFLLLQLVQGVGRRRRRQFFGQQKIAGVAFGHLQDFAFFPEFFYFLQ